MDRHFEITPKTPHEVLLSFKSVGNTEKQIAAADMVANMKELEPKIDWDQAIDEITMGDRGRAGRPLRGIPAIAERTGANVISYAKAMGIDLGDPDVVLLSALFFLNQFDFRAKLAQGRLDRLKSGELQLPRPEDEEVIGTKFANMSIWKSIIRETVGDLAQTLGTSKKDLLIMDAVICRENDNPTINHERATLFQAIQRDSRKSPLPLALKIQQYRNSEFVYRKIWMPS